MAGSNWNKLGSGFLGAESSLRCIFCKSIVGLRLVAHRDEKGFVTGFIVVCESCAKDLDDCYFRVNVFKDTKEPNVVDKPVEVVDEIAVRGGLRGFVNYLNKTGVN